EQPGDHPPAVLRRRTHAQFAEPAAVLVRTLDVLVRADEVVVVVVEIGAVAVQRIVEVRVVRVVLEYLVLAPQVATGSDHVPAAELAFDRQRGLDPFVLAVLRIVLDDLQLVVDRRAALLREHAVRLGYLPHHGRADGPALVEVDPERDARAVSIDVVVVLFDEGRVVLGDARGRIGPAAGDIVDIAGALAVPADDAQRGVLAEA